MNIWLVKASQFLQQFCLIIWYKSRIEHIIPDALSRPASIRNADHNLEYSKLNTLFFYYTILVEINLHLIEQILDNYTTDN